MVTIKPVNVHRPYILPNFKSKQTPISEPIKSSEGDYAKTQKEISKTLKENDIKIKSEPNFWWMLAEEVSDSNVLKEIAKENGGMKIKCTNDFAQISEIVEAKIEYADKSVLLVGDGDDLFEAYIDLAYQIKNIDKEGKEYFENKVDDYMTRQENFKLEYENTMKELEDNKIKRGFFPITRRVLVAVSESNVLKEISKENDGLKISYCVANDDAYGATTYLTLKFADKSIKLRGDGDDLAEADIDINNQIRQIEKNGKEEFLEQVDTYMAKNPKKSIFQKIFG